MPASLTTLTEWGRAFTHGAFEAPKSDSEWLSFFDSTIAPNAEFNFNGRDVPYEQAKKLLMQTREKFSSQTIRWLNIEAMPKDPAKPAEAGIIAGFYTNTGYYRNPDDPTRPAFVIKRIPHLYVESEDPNSEEDTRRVVKLIAIMTETAVANLEE